MSSVIKWIKIRLHTMQSQDRWWFAALAMAILLSLLSTLSASPAKTKGNETKPFEDVTTYIPAGFVLVPINLANFDSVDSILGQTGVVDLFSADPERPGQSRLVVRQIKILRSPMNPNHFAVLAPESQAPEIVRHSANYIAVLQNPKNSGTRFEQRGIRRSRLSIEEL